MNQTVFEIDVTYDIDSSARIQTVSCKPDRIFYLPTPNINDTLIALNAGICAFACAINQRCEEKYIVHIKHNFALPELFIKSIEDYNMLSAYCSVEFEGPRILDCHCQLSTPYEIAHLFSGGKDSVYQLQKLLQKHGRQNITTVYIGGMTVNAEYRKELIVAERISKKLEVPLSYVHLEHADYERNSLCVRIRTIWRE